MPSRETNDRKFRRKLFLDIETKQSRQELALGEIAGYSKNNKDGRVHKKHRKLSTNIAISKNPRPIFPILDK
jgi:hypothetical protein